MLTKALTQQYLLFKIDGFATLIVSGINCREDIKSFNAELRTLEMSGHEPRDNKQPVHDPDWSEDETCKICGCPKGYDFMARNKRTSIRSNQIQNVTDYAEMTRAGCRALDSLLQLADQYLVLGR